MDIFFPHTFLERAAFKESAVKCGFVELTAETTANVGILPADERISTLLMAWKNIGNYLTKNPYNHDVGVTVSWVGRCTLNLWFGREWIACAIENKTDLIEQMMKVYPTAFITMHPYSWPYMFSIYRDPWMVEYLNLNFQRMSGPDLTPVLEPKDSEFIQQEGIPLLILRMVNMFDFRMVKLVKYMCLRLLLTWQDVNSTASRTLRASPNADKYIDYARHIYLLAICENNGFKDLHYTLETIQRVVHCDLTETWPLELGAQAIAKGLQEANMTLTELLIAFLFKVPKLQFSNIFGAALTKYINFITEYQLRNINRLSSVKLSWPLQEVYSKLVQMFITHRESSEDLIKTTSKLSEQIFLGMHNLTASKCAYELIKQRPQAEWHTSKITLLLTIISEEINIIQDYKYNDVQSTDDLIEKEKEVAIYYRDLAKLFQKSPYLEQEAWLTTFSLHPCREFMDAVIKCGGRNHRAIKKQALKLKVIETPDSKSKINEKDTTNNLKEDDKEKNALEVIVANVSDTTDDQGILRTCAEILQTSGAVASTPPQDTSKTETKPKAKRPPRKKLDQNGAKKIEPKIKDEPKDKITSCLVPEEIQCKRGRPVGALNKSKSDPMNPTKKTPARKSGEKPDLAEEIFAAAAGAAENINSQTAETIKYPAFALMNSVTDTEELMKFTNYDDAYEQYTELNKILSRIKLNNTCYEDLLTLLIAPRYKRLTWAVSWKKLKKRCRVILTKDNKKRELVEQSMADANDRLTHLNIDYEKYKDKPQIDYGTIEGGYECYDTDSDDEELKKTEVDTKKTNNRPVARKKVKKLHGSSYEDLKGENQNPSIDIKPFLKIENLDSSTSNLLNIIESTHLSKPVYLNKPVYFVRNPLASPSSETAISLETGPENQPSNRTSSRRSTGEETLTSDSFEEHHWHLTTTETSPEMKRDLQEQKVNISPFRSSNSLCRSFLKTETTFNIPASIRQQLEQPTMFFKLEPKTESEAEANTLQGQYSIQEDYKNKQTELMEPLKCSPPIVTEIYHHASTLKHINPVLASNTRFSPKLFEDMPEDLTMPKSSNSDLYETNMSLSNLPLNLTGRLVTEPECKEVSFHEKLPNQIDQSVHQSLKKGKKQQNRSMTKINSRKRQTKEDRKYLRKEVAQDVKKQSPNTQLSSQKSLITQPNLSLKSVRIFPHNKNSKAIRINPTAAVVFSSAAASYHRTPFLNVAQQEPNILQQLLSKEIKPFGDIGEFFDKTTVEDAEAITKSEDETSSACKLDAQLGATLEVQKSSIQSLLSTTTETKISKTNRRTDLKAVQIIKPISPSISLICDSELKNSSTHNTEKYQPLQNDITCNNALENISIDLKNSEKAHKLSHTRSSNTLVDDESTKFPKVTENLNTDDNFITTSLEDSEFAANNVMRLDSTIKAFNLLDKSKNIKFSSSDTEFEFKVPAPVVKPCFFLRTKQKKVHSYVSDWVKNIIFNDKTAEIVVPVSSMQKVPQDFELTKNSEADDGINNKIIRSNRSTALSSQSKSDDILYNKHIVFNKKLLDPHLKTYKNTKAACKITDTKKLKEHFLGTNELYSGNSEETSVFNSMDDAQTLLLMDEKQIKEDGNSAFEPNILNVLGENSKSNSLLEQSTSHERQLTPPLASTSQNTVQTESESSPVKAKKKRSRKNTPSTKKFDQMFDWIDMVTSANREPVPESLDTPRTLLNLFSAQLMNQAKSIHFNYEYLREKEMLYNRVNDEGVNCEASILLASPGPSEDCVKLIKAFKKSTVFKGVDMGSNEVSFTSSLAKEVLGTIVKLTLNESKTHISCSNNHFDASDALDEFTRSRREANSPTFYSPTLSMKHLRNGTLADSVECIDTSLEKLIPKPGRKRSSMPARLPIKKRIRKQNSVDNTIKCEDDHHLLDEANQLPLKEMVFLTPVAETTVTDILIPPSSECKIDSLDEANQLPLKVMVVSEPVAESSVTDILKQPLMECNHDSLDEADQLPLKETVFTKPESTVTDMFIPPISECNHDSLVEINQIPHKEIVYSEPIVESNVTDIIMPLHVEPNTSVDCSIMANTSENVLMTKVTKPLAHFCLKQHSFDNVKQKPVEINSTEEYINEQTSLKEEIIKPVTEENICVTLKEPSEGIQEKEKTTEQESHEQLDYKLNEEVADETLKEDKIIENSGEPNISQVKVPNINRYPKRIPTKRIQMEGSCSAFQRNRRNTYDGTKYILKDETVTILSPEKEQSIEEPIQLPEEVKSDNSDNREGKCSKDSFSGHFSDETKHLSKQDCLKTTEISSSTAETQLRGEIEEAKKFQIEDSLETKQISLGEYATLEANQSLEDQQLNLKEINSLDESSQKLPEETNEIENSEETSKQTVVEETKQFPIEMKEIEPPLMKISSEEENNQSAVKKRIVKPRISYAELDSDSDELVKSRLKIPSLKINFPSIRPIRRKLINRSLPKKIASNKSSVQRPSKSAKQKTKHVNKIFECEKTNPCSSLNDSDDDVPLYSQIVKPNNDKFKNVSSHEFEDSNADCRPTKSTSPINDSDDDAPLKRLPRKLCSKKTLTPLKTKKNTSKLPIRKKYRNAYSPKRPSVRIQSKFSRPSTTSLNYFALFLSDSDEDEPIKSKRRRRTPDRLWTTRTAKRKEPKESVTGKISQQRKLRCNRVGIKQRQSRKRLPKSKLPVVKMPVLTREDSDHTVEENIYECATMSTANETDEDACSEIRPKRRRQKVVKPMRIRCVSRRAIPTDAITESSSCSSLATVQTARELGINSTSIASFPKRGRLLRRNTLEKSLLMSKLLCESSSSSSPVMKNRPKRQFAAKSTSKPSVIKENNVYNKPKHTVLLSKCAANTRSAEPLTFMEKEAIQNHNCVNFQIRLQRLTANEAVLCRKPFVRLERNFVQDYFAEKNLEYKEELKPVGLNVENN